MHPKDLGLSLYFLLSEPGQVILPFRVSTSSIIKGDNNGGLVQSSAAPTPLPERTCCLAAGSVASSQPPLGSALC